MVGKRRDILLSVSTLALLIGAALLVHYKVLSLSLADNELSFLRDARPLRDMEALLQRFLSPLKRPLPTAIFAGVFRIFGEREVAYFSVNLLLHLINGILVYSLSRTMSLRWPFFCAALFLAHPLGAAAASYLFGLSYLMGTAFMLLALIVYEQAGSHRRGGRSACLLIVMLLVLMLLSKQVFIYFPLIIWISPFFLKRPRHLTVENNRALAVGAGVAVLFVAGYAIPNAMRSPVSPLTFAAAQLSHYWELAAAFLWPDRLSFVTLVPLPDKIQLLDILGGLGLLAAAALGLYVLGRTRCGLLFAMFLISLIPANSVFPKVELLLGWRLYPALVFFCLFAGSLAESVFKRLLAAKFSPLRYSARSVFTAAAALLLVKLGVMTHAGYDFQGDAFRRWEEESKAHPHLPLPYLKMAEALMKKNDFVRARELTLKACHLAKRSDCDQVVRNNRDFFLAKKGTQESLESGVPDN